MKTSLRGAVVLMYHSINYVQTNPWDICVSPECFEEQVKFLKDNFYVTNVDELVTQLKQKNVQSNSVCITFDDGYADNFINAKSILEKYNCPAAFFIPTAFVGRKTFWWDELEYIFLHQKKLPAVLYLMIGNMQQAYHIKETELTTAEYLAHTQWKWYKDAPTTRCKVFMKIWKALRPLNLPAIQQAIYEIKLWADAEVNEEFQRYTIDGQQLKLMNNHELFTIGLHTHTHADLHGKNKAVQHDEITNCRNYLQSNSNIQANILAYPYGRFDNNSLQVSAALNIDACFTTMAGVINNTTNKYTLNRLQVNEWNSRDLNKQITEVE